MKIRLLTLLFILGFVPYINANNAQGFELDESQISNVFQSTDQLESYLLNNDEADFQSAEILGLTNTIALNTLTMPSAASLVGDNPVMGIPSYIWGGCLSIVGVGIVYLTLEKESDDTRKEETKKALIGCVAGGCLMGGAYFVLARGAYY
jgi:hypothetical protein